MNTVGFISLGCPKNQIDGECLLASLDAAGFEIVDPYNGVDAVIINTCGFIESAKKEAIENILDMAELKEEGVIGKIIVTGCLAERYKDEILTEMPEVDAVVGIGANADIADICRRVIDGERIGNFPAKEELPLNGQRILTTPEYYAYLKIADGCNNCCTYCAIPQIRGRYRSREMDDIIEEAKNLAEKGVKATICMADSLCPNCLKSSMRLTEYIGSECFTATLTNLPMSLLKLLPPCRKYFTTSTCRSSTLTTVFLRE